MRGGWSSPSASWPRAAACPCRLAAPRAWPTETGTAERQRPRSPRPSLSTRRLGRDDGWCRARFRPDPQRARRRRRAAPLEPVNPFADEVELQRVAARLRRAPGSRSATSASPPASTVCGQPGPRVVAFDERAVGGAQLRAEPHETPAVAAPARETRVPRGSGRACARAAAGRGRPTSGSPGSSVRTSIAARGVAPGIAFPSPLSSQTS